MLRPPLVDPYPAEIKPCTKRQIEEGNKQKHIPSKLPLLDTLNNGENNWRTLRFGNETETRWYGRQLNDWLEARTIVALAFQSPQLYEPCQDSMDLASNLLNLLDETAETVADWNETIVLRGDGLPKNVKVFEQAKLIRKSILRGFQKSLFLFLMLPSLA